MYGQHNEGQHNSFIFKIDTFANEIVKMSSKKTEKIETIDSRDFLPCFGNDLCLYENCNVNTKSFSDIGCNYETPYGIKKET